MKCVAVGDMFLEEVAFAKELTKCSLFSSYQGFSWKGDQTRKEARKTIREIETKGSNAFEIPGDMKEAMLDADIIFIHLCPIGKEIIRQAKHLKYIVSARGGVENIDVEEAKAKGIGIIHCPIHNAYAVAEMTIGLMICETRNVARADHALKEGIWRESYPNSGYIRELRSCTIGLLGFGVIGRLVAERLQPFGCRIIIHDPFVEAVEIESYGYGAVDKETLLKQSDIVSLHGRMEPDDPPLIGATELNLMKKSAYLINTARAVLVDMDALAKTLQEHNIQGAGVDVFPKEPLAKDDALLYLDNCTLTNHRGGDTFDSYNRSPEILLKQLKEVLATGKTRYMIRR